MSIPNKIDQHSSSDDSLAHATLSVTGLGHSITMPGLDTESLLPRHSLDTSDVSVSNPPGGASGHHSLHPKGKLKVSASAMDMRHGGPSGDGPTAVVVGPDGTGIPLTDLQRAATVLSNEGVKHYKRKHYQDALNCFTHVRDMLTKAMGSRHREVANALNNMALVHRKMKNLKKACSLYEDALAIDLTTLKKDDPLIATTMFNLARVQEEDKQLGRALNLYQSALDIRRAALKADSKMDEASVAKVLYHLAFVQKALGNQHAFHTAMAETTAIYVRVYGQDHKHTQDSIEQLLIGGDLTRSRSNKHLKKKSTSKDLKPSTSTAKMALDSIDEKGSERKGPE